MQSQIDDFTMKVNNYCFTIDQKLIVIESYKEQIDTNTKQMDEFIKHTGETLLDMRHSLEKEKKNNLTEFNRND